MSQPERPRCVGGDGSHCSHRQQGYYCCHCGDFDEEQVDQRTEEDFALLMQRLLADDLPELPAADDRCTREVAE